MRWTEGHIVASQRPWKQGPRRGRSAWHACGWVSREPGRPRRLHLKDRRGAGTGSPSPRPWTQHLASDGAKPQVLGWYRRAKATKRGGTGGEESERLILPAKEGNRVRETLWRGCRLRATAADTPRAAFDNARETRRVAHDAPVSSPEYDDAVDYQSANGASLHAEPTRPDLSITITAIPAPPRVGGTAVVGSTRRAGDVPTSTSVVRCHSSRRHRRARRTPGGTVHGPFGPIGGDRTVSAPK